MINTCVADVLSTYADKLEQSKDFEKDVQKLITATYKEHGRIVFNGNNYSKEWTEEAKRRGLLNLATTPEALPLYSREENVAMFVKHKIYTREEIEARQEILMENYCKIIHIEALTMLEMANREILPACFEYMKVLSVLAVNKKALRLACGADSDLITKINLTVSSAYETVQKLSEAAQNAKKTKSINDEAFAYRDVVLPLMNALRKDCDEMDALVSKEYWPFPTYGDLMFSV